MHILHSPWLRILISSGLLYFFAILYCQNHFFRDPGSRFYDEKRAFDRSYSNIRKEQAKQYIDVVSKTDTHQRTGASPKICASFISVKRDGAHYLPYAIASLLDRLTEQERADLFVNVMVAHINIGTHPIADLTWPFDVTDRIASYNITAEQRKTLAHQEATHNFAAKAVFDYTHALESCYNTGAPWIVIFEDDITLADGWFIRTLHAVREIEADMASGTRDWLFMRLFNQERSIGWASRSVGGNHEILISLCAGIVAGIVLTFLKRSSRLGHRHIDTPSIFIICCLTIPAFVILFFQAGKASLVPPKPGVHEEVFGCCAQGMVFPRHQVYRIQEYLLDREEGQIDRMLDELAETDKLARFALYPVSLQHIGTKSTRKTLLKEAQATWSMAFEQQDPLKLEHEHNELVKLVYGKSK